MIEHALPRRQLGVTLVTQATVAFIAIILALLAIRIAPVVTEYMTISRHVKNIAKDVASQKSSVTVDEIRATFNKLAQVDDIQSLSGSDLDVSKEGGEVVIAFAYSKKVPLVGPVSLCFDFQGATTPSGGK